MARVNVALGKRYTLYKLDNFGFDNRKLNLMCFGLKAQSIYKRAALNSIRNIEEKLLCMRLKLIKQ